MIQLTGEIFHLSDGRTMLLHNEQDAVLSVGSYIVFEGKVYRLSGIAAPTRPHGKWAVQIEALLPDDPYYDADM